MTTRVMGKQPQFESRRRSSHRARGEHRVEAGPPMVPPLDGGDVDSRAHGNNGVGRVVAIGPRMLL